jgi:UDP-galactopyranose mutase
MFRPTAGADHSRAQFPVLVCFSHLRWDFVYQRPQHLMGRLAESYDVIFWEEPTLASGTARLDERRCATTGVRVVTPILPDDLAPAQANEVLASLLRTRLEPNGKVAVRWYYTPMMLAFSRQLAADCTVYDCMDELSNFRFAPPELQRLENDLFGLTDLVFTGGYSLYEAKREKHPAVYAFPSSVDGAHFAQARATPAGSSTDGPRLGFYGVIDERMDLELLAALCDARPEWSIEIVGPVAKIDPAELPVRANLTYSGPVSYADLPARLAAWDVALMPFAINESTRFISPTKTPEYLAGGRPVVSVPIVDVARHYGELDGVKIAGSAEAFVRACDEALALARSDSAWLEPVDRLLAEMSWDRTVSEMVALIHDASSKPRHYDYVIVGAGFAGSVMAERLARDSGKRVLVIDRRAHVAGNAYDHRDENGILIHQYGPHIFHTNSAEIVAYLSAFTAWRPYTHRVLASIDGMLVPIPINRTTINALYGLSLTTDQQAADFLAARAEPTAVVETSEDVVVTAVGRDLYEKFFRGYTRKQWGLDPSQLDKAVTSRVPTRTDTDDRYFTDVHQAMPADGYTAMFERMLDHPGIDIMLGTDFADLSPAITFDRLVYTGPIDEYFGYRYGKLPYRSLRFQHERLDQETFQPVAVVNYPDEATPFTRITEYKYLTGQVSPQTSITYEYPSDEGDPYYPVPRAENQELFKRYEALALAEPNVIFVGRLATYRYYNMDQVVGQALATYRRLKAREANHNSLAPASAEQAA